MAKIIKHQLFYPHPLEVVWDYLTKPELIAQWLMPSDFAPVLGHEFRFTVNPMPQFDFDGIIYCKILEITPPETLSYSWKWGSGDGSLHDSEVNWTLTAKDEGTELLLVHNAFQGADTLPIFAAMDTGWISNMNKMLLRIKEKIDGTTKA